MPGNGRTFWLAATLVVTLVTAIVLRSGGEAPGPPAQPRSQGRVPTEALAIPSDVQLEALTRARTEPLDNGRNPFRFGSRSAPEAPAPVRRLPNVPDDQVDAPVVRAPTGPPPPPPITLKFIGMVQKADGTKIAALSDGRRVIQGREGEEIEGRYKILKIGLQSLEIAYLDGRGRQTIPMTGQ